MANAVIVENVTEKYLEIRDPFLRQVFRGECDQVTIINKDKFVTLDFSHQREELVEQNGCQAYTLEDVFLELVGKPLQTLEEA